MTLQPRQGFRQGQTQQTRQARPSIQQNFMMQQKIKELEVYVRNTLAMGYTTENIRNYLIQNGWPAEIVDQVMNKIRMRRF